MTTMSAATAESHLSTAEPLAMTASTAEARRATFRTAGLAALAFGAGVVIANAVMVGAPMADGSAADAAAWFSANRLRIVIANAMVALTFPALLVFAGAMRELGAGSEVARRWMRVGGLGGAAMVGVFSIVVGGNIAAVHLAEAGETAFAIAWRIHFAGFAVNMTVLGTAFLGFALGAHAAGLTRGWQRTMGVAGAACLLVTGFANTAVAGGSYIALVGLLGFIAWLVWLFATGIRLLRAAR
jgi:hypothetical protein